MKFDTKIGFLKFTCDTVKEKQGLVRHGSQKIQSFSALCEVRDSHPNNFIIFPKSWGFVYLHFKPVYIIKTVVNMQILNIIQMSDFSLNNIP